MTGDLERLCAVADQPFEACEREWQAVLGRLRLGVGYVPAIQKVIGEGRWKTAPNPMAYVRKAAVRTAVRMGIIDIRPNQEREILACDLQYEDDDGEEMGHDDKLGIALHHYEEEFGTDYEPSLHPAEDRLPDVLLNENLDIEWDRVGDLAGLDAGERLVLDLQVIGFGRDAALRACLTDDDRRYLQAAWKRFYRKRETLSAVLRSGESHPARSRQDGWAELELIFVETDEGELKISFQNSVPEMRK